MGFLACLAHEAYETNGQAVKYTMDCLNRADGSSVTEQKRVVIKMYHLRRL